MMINSLSLLVAVLVSLQCTFETSALDRNIDSSLELKPRPVPRRRRISGLRILDAPPPVVEFTPGTTLILSCNVTGTGMPNMQWFRNGKPITTYEEEGNEILPVHSSAISSVVSKLLVTSAASGDVFTCLATSRGKQDSKSTTIVTTAGNEAENLVTIQRLFEVPSGPIITYYVESLLQDVGTDVVLPCKVHSSTKTQTFWEDTTGTLVYGNPKYRVLPSGDLLVQNLGWDDIGDFNCIVTDMYGRSDNATTFIYTLIRE